MDQNLVYVKTPAGNEAIRERAQLTQRNLRMVLVQVDGKASVATLGVRLGNSQLVEDALVELEGRGLVSLVSASVSNSVAAVPIEPEEKTEKERAEKERAEGEKAEREEAEREEAEREKTEREKAEKERAEKERAEREEAEREKAEREKAEREKAEKEKAEKERAEREEAEKERAERERAEREKAEREKAEREKAEREKAERERAERERAERERAERERAEKEKAEKEKAKREKAERKKAEKENRKAISTGRRVGAKAAIFFLVMGILLPCLGVLLFPYNQFKPEMEAALQRTLQTPVRIGDIGVGIWPRPALILQQIDLGESYKIRIDNVRLPIAASMLNSSHRVFPVADIDNLSLPVEALALLSRMSPETSGQGAGFTLGRVNFNHFTLKMSELSLSKLDGQLFFRADGGVDKLHFETEDRTLRFNALPTAQGTALEIDGYGWKPFGDTSYVFDSVQAKGYLEGSRLTLRDVDAGLVGGKLRGNIFLDWSSGLVTSGEAVLDRLSVGRAAQIMVPDLKAEGELSGRLSLKSTAGDWSALRSNVEWGLEADVARGALIGVDLAESVRRGSGKAVRGGTTKFDRLRANIRIGPQGVSANELRLEAGPLTASGRFFANSERQVDGSFDVKISSSVMSIRMPIRVSGEWPNLVATAGR